MSIYKIEILSKVKVQITGFNFAQSIKRMDENKKRTGMFFTNLDSDQASDLMLFRW